MNRPLNEKHDQILPDGDPLDRMLNAHFTSAGEELTPSSGFVVSVMESVQAQAGGPSPIAFPWRRVVPGIVAMVCGLAVLIVFAVHSGATSAPAARHTLHFALSLKPAFNLGGTVLGSVLLAAGLSITAIAASFRLTGRSR